MDRSVTSSLLKHWNDFLKLPGSLVFRQSDERLPSDIESKIEKYRELKYFSKSDFSNPSVKNQWFLSRWCLIDVIEDLKTQNLSVSQMRLSLSHTKLGSIAVGCNGKLLKGIGVDLEFSNRKISSGILEKISGSEERRFGLDLLNLWVLKEACFKSYPENLGTSLIDYGIIEAQTTNGNTSGRVKIKSDTLEFSTIHASQFLLGVSKFR